MTLSWPELVTSATAESTDVLIKGADQDWSRPAGELDWSCRTTLDHMALSLVCYTGLLIAQPADRFVTLFASLDEQAPISACLEGIRIAGTILVTTLRDAAPEARAWHPWGSSDGPGFAAMAVTELLVHTHDITQTLGVDWTPPDELCAPAVERIFPDAPTGHAPAHTLLWCAGRIALPGLSRRQEWQWDGTVR